jgi:hypothetical protein
MAASGAGGARRLEVDQVRRTAGARAGGQVGVQV